MLISYNWLKEYLHLDLDPNDLAEKMTLHGLEVVHIRPVHQRIPGLMIGEVLEKIPHPNADRLFLTRIKYLNQEQEEEVPVVCGAKNIAVGQKIILATVGTRLTHDLKIKKAKIRNVDSVGMVCSKEELGLEKKSEGIWVLPPQTTLDQDPQTLIGEPDFIYEIEITSNRPDCLSVCGIAREVSALLDQSFNSKSPSNFNQIQNDPTKVEIQNRSDCPHYLVKKISQVKIAPSPTWVQTRLHHHKIRPINNIVDVTNLMLLEYGQPLHAFDAGKIKNKVIVRNAFPKEKLVILDQKELTLDSEDLVIADQDRPIALAGVMGGDDSAVDDSTQEILLEAAIFNPLSIRKTARRHKIQTEASYYFERFVDPTQTAYVLDQALKLILKLAGGKVSYVTLDQPVMGEEKKILLRGKNVKRTIGIDLTQDQIAQLLKRLKFKIKFSSKEHLEVVVPSFRNDIHQEWDIIEEVARMYGYNKIPEQLPRITNSNWNLEHLVNQSLQKSLPSNKNQNSVPSSSSNPVKKSRLIRQTRNLLMGLGYHEIVTYPFFENQLVEKTYPQLDHLISPLNPVWVDISLLRDQLLFGMLKTIKSNLEKGNHHFNKAYEVGHLFYRAEKQYLEEEHFSLCIWGQPEKPTWSDPTKSELSFYDLSGDLEEYFHRLGYPSCSIEVPKVHSPHQNIKFQLLTDSTAAVIKIDETVVGWIGMVDPKILVTFDLKQKIYYAQINLEALTGCRPPQIQYKKISSYPAIKRDLAIVIDDDLKELKNIRKILIAIKHLSKLVSEVELQNIYSGDHLEPGKKSVVFTIKLRSQDRTLERKEADEEILTLVKKLRKKFSFELR